MDILKWIEDWFSKNCDGDWKHSHGIKISTLDNPGWTLSINLDGTPLKRKKFEPIKIERSESNWVHCNVQGAIF